MKIFEYHCFEGFLSSFNCLGGRWKWEFNDDEHLYGEEFMPKLTFFDLFGKHENIVFNIPRSTLTEEINKIIPISFRYVIMESQDYDEQNEDDYSRSWSVLHLNWLNAECKRGTKRFMCDILESNPMIGAYANYPLIDRADRHSSEGPMHFLICRKENNFLRCMNFKINEELECEQIGLEFQLPLNLFNAMDLNKNIICGLSDSRDVITSYDLNTGQILNSIQQVHGLPPSICLQQTREAGYLYLPIVGVWTSKLLFLWSEEKQENETEKYFSHIWIVHLGTGNSQKLEHIFNGRIRQMFISVDGNLMVQLESFLRYEIPHRAFSKMLHPPMAFLELKMICMENESSENTVVNNMLNSWQANTANILNKKFLA